MDKVTIDSKIVDAYEKLNLDKEGDMDERDWCINDGTKKGGDGRSTREIIDEMRQGTEIGILFYGLITGDSPTMEEIAPYISE